MPSNIPCRQLCQLKFHQLLQSETQVVYPEGLNGCLVPVVTSLPKSLAHGMNDLNDEPTFLQVDLSQFAVEEHESKALIPGNDSTSTSPTCPAMAPSPKVESQVSMTTEVSELLLQVLLNTSSQASGSSTPKRPVSMALSPHPLLGWKIPPNLWTPLLRCHCRWTHQTMQSEPIRPLRRFMPPHPLQSKLWDLALAPPWACDSAPKGGKQGIRTPIGD